MGHCLESNRVYDIYWRGGQLSIQTKVARRHRAHHHNNGQLVQCHRIVLFGLHHGGQNKKSHLLDDHHYTHFDIHQGFAIPVDNT